MIIFLPFKDVTKVFATVLFSLLLTGCAFSVGAQKNFTTDAKRSIQLAEWEKAYRTLEDALGSTDPNTRLAAYDLITSTPEIKRAADKTFSLESLTSTFDQFDIFTANELEKVRLSWYSKFASDEDISSAEKNLSLAYRGASERKLALTEARRSGVGKLLVDEVIFRQLAAVDQQKFRTLYPMMTVLPLDVHIHPLPASLCEPTGVGGRVHLKIHL